MLEDYYNDLRKKEFDKFLNEELKDYKEEFLQQLAEAKKNLKRT